jgi:ABC-type polar amino acid transport system ATPase subunit
MIKIKNLSVDTPSNKRLLTDLTCWIPAGRITTLIGKSGAGKTTLLRTIAGLGDFTSQGAIEVDGKALATLSNTERASLIGFVAQDLNLFPHLTALDNCMQPLMVVKKLNGGCARARALEVLTWLDMAILLNMYPKDLSGGQKQRVAIARALCMGPKTLLLDEPTSALDPQNAAMLVSTLKRLCQQGIAILVISQDMAFVRMVCDRLYLLEEGKIIESFDSQDSESLAIKSRLYNFLNF